MLQKQIKTFVMQKVKVQLITQYSKHLGCKKNPNESVKARSA